MFESPPPKSTARKSRLHWCAAIINIVSLVMIALMFILPWYERHEWFNSKPFYHDEYYLLDYARDGTTLDYHPSVETPVPRDVVPIGDLMDQIAMFLILSLVASVIALAFSCLAWRIPGVLAGAAAAALLLLTSVSFYFGIIDTLDLDGFSGHTYWSRSTLALTGPMLGYLMSVVAPVVQAAQSIVLAHSGDE